jgi:phospholipid-translocating ATPase
MLLAITCFYDSFTNIVTITFSTLVLIELLNVLSEVHKIKTKMVLSITLTLIIYFTSIVILRQYFQLSYVNQAFVVQVLALSLACWLPLQLF